MKILARQKLDVIHKTLRPPALWDAGISRRSSGAKGTACTRFGKSKVLICDSEQVLRDLRWLTSD